MVAKSRTVRVTGRAPGALAVESAPEPAADREATEADSSVQHIVSQQRRQQRQLFLDVTTRLRRTAADLQHLCQLRQTAEPKHPAPWCPTLAGHERLITNEEAWREYERRYLFTTPSVQLPPPQEVNIELLKARLSAQQQMLPAPDRTCAQGFFPPAGRGRLAHNEPRQRYLLPGARLPNTVLIRLLWSTRTLMDVEFYRAMENRRSRRRQLWEFFEWSDSEDGQEPPERLDRLESVATRRRNRRKVSMTKHEHLENWLHIAESGVDEGAARDSDDEGIARARRRRFSHRGRLLSEEFGTPATETDAYTPAPGRFTCGARMEGKERSGKGSRGESRARRAARRSGGGVEGYIGEDSFSSGSGESEYFHGDDDRGINDLGGSSRVYGRGIRGSDPGGIHTDQGPDRQARDSRHHTGLDDDLGLPPAVAADGQAMPAGHGWATSTPWTASGGQPVNMSQAGQPSRRTGSPSPRPRTRAIPAGGEKVHLSAPNARPDMEAQVDRPPDRRHALRMAHLFEVKDYVCEDSKKPGAHGAERDMKAHGIRHSSFMQKHKQQTKAMAGSDDVGRMLQSRNVWSVSRIPGIFYEASSSNDYEPKEESSDLGGEVSKESTRPYASIHPRSGLPGSRFHTFDEDSPLHRLAVDYIQHLMQHEWAQDLLHDVNRDALDPWDAAERLVKRLAKQPFEIQREILLEVQTIQETFPAPDSLRPLSNGIVTLLYPATDDVATLNTAINTLILLADQMDVVMASILALLTLEKLDVKECLQSLLARLGLVDPHHVLLAEVRSWAPSCKRKNLNSALHKEINKKALNFVANWTEAFEAHSRLIAQEVNKRKMDAIVKYNIIKILKNYEPRAIEETGDGFNVSLREPSNTSRLNNPEVIEVLNYFVEMTDEEDELQPARRQSVHSSGEQEVSDPLEWRRANKDILVPPCPSPLVQGNRPLASGVLQPTALVTHWTGAAGLAPAPWPTVTVGIHLRIADKYYRGTQQPAQRHPVLH